MTVHCAFNFALKKFSTYVGGHGFFQNVRAKSILTYKDLYKNDWIYLLIVCLSGSLKTNDFRLISYLELRNILLSFSLIKDKHFF